MAETELSKKALGSTVYFQESDGTSVGYIVAMHGYRGNNCLLARSTNLPKRPFYDNWVGFAKWKESSLRSYLNGEWLESLDPEMAKLLAEVTMPDDSTCKVFVPSCSEFGIIGSDDQNDDVKLSAEAIKAIMEGRGTEGVWTRDVCINYEEYEDDESEIHRDNAMLLRFSSTRGDVWSDYDSIISSYEVLVFIAVSEALNVTDEESGSNVTQKYAPEILCDYTESEELGAKAKPFSFGYTIADPDSDTVTVTETVGTTVIKTYTAVVGVENQFVIGQALYDALTDEQYYDLGISATDGTYTTKLTVRFLKTSTRGYRVYAGTIATKVNRASIASGGYAFEEKVCIYDPCWQDEERMIFDPTVTFEKNDFGSFEFTLPKENVYYDKIEIRKTAVTVEEDGETIWTGYVLEVGKDFKMDKVVYCRGEMGYLGDLACSVASKEWTAGNLFKSIVGTTSSAGIKAFRVGEISPELSGEKVDTTDSGTQYTTVWGALNDILLGNAGGIIRLRIRRDKTDSYGVGYTRYLDFLSDVDDKTNQTIEFGRNLLDLNYYMSGYDIVNRIIVYGYETTGWWFWKTTSPISVTVSDSASIEKYGVVERSLFVEGTKSTSSDLRSVGQKKLKEMCTGLAGGIEISALDLKDAGVDVNRLGFLKKARILSKPHGIDEWELCTKLELPLDDPANKKFTFGDTIDAISVKQASDSSSTRRALSGMESIISYINGTADAS